MQAGSSLVRKAVVFAAGEGTRLRPLTLNRPKHLLPLAGKPLIYWILKAVEYAGVREVGVVVHYKAEMIASYLKKLDTELKIRCILQHKPNGTAGALEAARNYIDGEEFLLVYGDVVVDRGDLKEMISLFRRGIYDAVVLGVQVENPWDYGVFRLKEGKLMESVVEKPPRGQEPSNLINGGVYVFSSRILKFLDKVGFSVRGEKELTDALQMLASRGKVFVYQTERRKWRDIGKPWDLLEANGYLLRAYPPLIPKGGFSRGVVIREPVYIGKGVEIGDYSIIGPNVSIYDDVKIGRFSRVSNSIIMAGTKIGDRTSVNYSIVGENVVLGDKVTVLFRSEDRGNVKMVVKGRRVDTGRKEMGCVIGDEAIVGSGSLIKAGAVIFNKAVIPPGSVVEGVLK